MNNYCNGCKTFKASSEFNDNNKAKEFKTCNDCCQRFSNKQKILDDNLHNSELEVVDLDFLSKTIMELLEYVHSELNFHYKINISNYNNSNKDLANEIVELIEDADEYRWIYNQQYKSKKSKTFWYYCSQQNILSTQIHQSNKTLHQWKDLNVMVS